MADDTNAVADVFGVELATGLTSRASVASDGSQGDAASTLPALANGGVVAFESEATNLAASDTNAVRDIFVRGPMP